MMSQEEILKLKHDPEIHWMPAWKWVTKERKPLCSAQTSLNLMGPFTAVWEDVILIEVRAKRITYIDQTFIIPDGFDDDYKTKISWDRVGKHMIKIQTCSKGIHSQPTPNSEIFKYVGLRNVNIALAIPIENTLSGGIENSIDGEKFRSACCWVLGETQL